MKTLSNTALPALGLLCLAAVSCNPEDPSAQREAQKLVAEAAAKNARLEDEVASLKAELASANSKIAEAEAVKMPGVSEIEGKLDAALSKLRESARKSHPSATVEGVTTWDVAIPSPEKLFTCKAKALVREPNGLLKTVYWTGSADIKGEWTFTSAVDLEPKAQPPPVASTQDQSDPAPEPPPKPAPPKEKPKPQYDIPLDRPVMGPK